jgi:glucosamine--fructose-6-phosphate aminotransferase (isomerizing)
METSYIAAHAFSGADLLRPAGDGREDSGDRGGTGRRERHRIVTGARSADRASADLCVVGSDGQSGAARSVSRCPPGAEEVSPMLEILPLQLLAYEIAMGAVSIGCPARSPRSRAH